MSTVKSVVDFHDYSSNPAYYYYFFFLLNTWFIFCFPFYQQFLECQINVFIF